MDTNSSRYGRVNLFEEKERLTQRKWHFKKNELLLNYAFTLNEHKQGNKHKLALIMTQVCIKES